MICVVSCNCDSSKATFSASLASLITVFITIFSLKVDAVSATGIEYSWFNTRWFSICKPWYACPNSCAIVTTSLNEPEKFVKIRDCLMNGKLLQNAPPTFPLRGKKSM